MKFRITPLNLAAVAFIVLAVDTWLNGAKLSGGKYEHFSNAICWIFLLFAVAVSFLDLTLRNLFPDTKKLWLIELGFITLAAIIYILAS